MAWIPSRGGLIVAVVNPIPKEKAGEGLTDVYNNLEKGFGHVPNFFGIMAHRPAVLKNFLPLYGSIMSEGTVEPRYKELAYLKTAMLNGCEY
jgi:hypothetical protein